MLRLVMIMVLAISTVSCRSRETQEVPAVLTNPEPATLLEIENAVSSATGGGKVTLAADVLTKTSLLVIERARQPGFDRPELGRDLGRPYHFQLVIAGTECKLLDRQTGKHWPLIQAECIKEE